MRLILGLAMFAAMALLTGSAIGQDKKTEDKIDGKKLIGKWATKEGSNEKFVIEFAKDGKFNLDAGDLKFDGTYKLEGNKLTIKAKIGADEKTMVRTITKLTDTELSSKEGDGKEDTLVRVKGKEKK